MLLPRCSMRLHEYTPICGAIGWLTDDGGEYLFTYLSISGTLDQWLETGVYSTKRHAVLCTVSPSVILESRKLPRCGGKALYTDIFTGAMI